MNFLTNALSSAVSSFANSAFSSIASSAFSALSSGFGSLTSGLGDFFGGSKDGGSSSAGLSSVFKDSFDSGSSSPSASIGASAPSADVSVRSSNLGGVSRFASSFDFSSDDAPMALPKADEGSVSLAQESSPAALLQLRQPPSDSAQFSRLFPSFDNASAQASTSFESDRINRALSGPDLNNLAGEVRRSDDAQLLGQVRQLADAQRRKEQFDRAMVSQFTNDPFEQAKAFGEYQQKLDNQHLALGAAAMAPGVGMGPALLDAKLYYQEGHPVDAAISAASALPLAGTGVGLAKGAMAAPLLAGMVKYERIEDFISAGYRYSGQALTKLKELGYSLKETAYLDVAAHAGGSRQNAATISQLVDKAGNAVGKPHTFNDEIFFDPHDKADKGARAWALLEDLNLFK